MSEEKGGGPGEGRLEYDPFEKNSNEYKSECPHCQMSFVHETSYNDLLQRQDRILEMLMIAEKTLSRIAGPKKKDGSYFYSIPQIQRMGDDSADTENARIALEKIEKLKK